MKKISIGDDKLEFIDNDDDNIIVVLKRNETIVSKEELMIVLKYLAKETIMSDQQRQQILEIASEMGVTIGELLEFKTPEMIIEEYNNKTFQILND